MCVFPAIAEGRWGNWESRFTETGALFKEDSSSPQPAQLQAGEHCERVRHAFTLALGISLPLSPSLSFCLSLSAPSVFRTVSLCLPLLLSLTHSLSEPQSFPKKYHG